MSLSNLLSSLCPREVPRLLWIPPQTSQGDVYAPTEARASVFRDFVSCPFPTPEPKPGRRSVARSAVIVPTLDPAAEQRGPSFGGVGESVRRRRRRLVVGVTTARLSLPTSRYPVPESTDT